MLRQSVLAPGTQRPRAGVEVPTAPAEYAAVRAAALRGNGGTAAGGTGMGGTAGGDGGTGVVVTGGRGRGRAGGAAAVGGAAAAMAGAVAAAAGGDDALEDPAAWLAWRGYLGTQMRRCALTSEGQQIKEQNKKWVGGNMQRILLQRQ